MLGTGRVRDHKITLASRVMNWDTVYWFYNLPTSIVTKMGVYGDDNNCYNKWDMHVCEYRIWSQ